jgi:hypothetical protein
MQIVCYSALQDQREMSLSYIHDSYVITLKYRRVLGADIKLFNKGVFRNSRLLEDQALQSDVFFKATVFSKRWFQSDVFFKATVFLSKRRFFSSKRWFSKRQFFQSDGFQSDVFFKATDFQIMV